MTTQQSSRATKQHRRKFTFSLRRFLVSRNFSNSNSTRDVNDYFLSSTKWKREWIDDYRHHVWLSFLIAHRSLQVSCGVTVIMNREHSAITRSLLIMRKVEKIFKLNAKSWKLVEWEFLCSVDGASEFMIMVTCGGVVNCMEMRISNITRQNLRLSTFFFSLSYSTNVVWM